MRSHAIVKGIRRYWMLVGALALIAALLAALTGFHTKKRYAATTEIFYSVSAGESATDMNQASTYLDREIVSYAALVKTPLVLQPAIDKQHLNTTVTDLAPSISTANPTSTTLLDITATDTDPDRAAAIANAVADSTVEVVSSVSPAPAGHGKAVNATVITRAQKPDAPAGMGMAERALAGLLVGAALGVLLAWLLVAKGLHLRDSEQLEDFNHRARHLGTIDATSSASITAPVGEDLRDLRASLSSRWMASHEGRGAGLVVSSARSLEASAALTLGLARALAETGRAVRLVDADLRHRTLTSSIGSASSRGVGDLSSGTGSVPLVNLTAPDLGFVAATQQSADAGAVVASPAMQRLLEQLAQEGDVVVVHAAPVLECADALTLAKALNAPILLAVDVPGTRSSSLERAITRASEAPGGAALVGVTSASKR